MKTSTWRNALIRFWDLVGGVSVRTKIFGIVLGSTTLLSLVFTWQVHQTMRQTLELKTKEVGISIARDLAARATDLILINDLYTLHQLLDETRLNFPDVRYAFILDQQDEVLAHTFGNEFPLELIALNDVQPDSFQNTQLIRTDEGLIWDVAVPIFEGKAGTARLGISDQSVRESLSELTTQFTLTISAVLAISLLAATFLTWILTRPILDLVEATRAIARGDFSPRVSRWANDEIGDLAEAYNQMADELERMDELRKEREQLRRQLLDAVISAQEEERQRIARELHDSTSQSLTSLMVGLRTLEAHCDNPDVHSQTEALRQVVSSTLDDVHNLAVQLRPSILDDLGLAAALERFTQDWEERNGIGVDLVVHLGEGRLPEAVEIALYRIIQEALTNVARHAQAKSTSVLVERLKNEVVAVIEDDGQGFDPSQSSNRPALGLLGIRERTELLGGKLTIESTPGVGTSLFIRIPLTVQEIHEREESI